MATYNYDVEYGEYGEYDKYGDSTNDNKPIMRNVVQIPQQDNQLPLYEDETVFNPYLLGNEDIQEDEDDSKDIEGDAIQDVQVTKDVSVGEKCTIKFAKKRNIFDNNDYVKGLVNDELSKFNKYIAGDDQKPYSICNIKDNVAYENCALSTGNPYFTLTYDNKTSTNVCSLPDASKMKLPSNSRYKITYNASTSNIIRPISEIYFKNEPYTFCQGRWHDWFCIPNYHLNNRWFNELPNDLENTVSVGRCLQPCKFGFVPTDKNVGKCIMKQHYNGGAYANVFDYTPLALICLLGTTFQSFINENSGGYIYYLQNIKKNILKDDAIELLKIKNSEEDVVENVIKNVRIDNEKNKIWTDVKADIQKYLRNMLENIPNINKKFIERNIVEPPSDILNIMTTYTTTDKILYAYSIAKHINDLASMDVQKYKEWRVNLKSLTSNTITELCRKSVDTLEDVQKYKDETDDQRIKRKADETFAYLLRILKRACNICFDGKSKYSSGTLLFTINKQSGSVSYPPIELDENYDPTDDEIKINDFYVIPQKEVGFFEDYINTIKSYENSLSTFLYFLIIVLSIFALQIIYIVFYKHINMVLNTILSFIIFRYYDIKYYLYNLLWSRWKADTRGSDKLKYIKDTYYNYIDYDNKKYDL